MNCREIGIFPLYESVIVLAALCETRAVCDLGGRRTLLWAAPGETAGTFTSTQNKFTNLQTQHMVLIPAGPGELTDTAKAFNTNLHKATANSADVIYSI